MPSSTALTPRRRASIWPGDGNGSEFGRSSSSIRVEQLAPREDGTWHRGPWADAGPDSCCHRDRGRGGLTIVMQKHNLDIPIKITPAADLAGKLSTLRTRITDAEFNELCRPAAFLRGGRSTMEDLKSEERRVGKEGVRTCRSRWSPYNSKKKNKK